MKALRRFVALLLAACVVAAPAAAQAPSKRLVIIDQDSFGPAGSNLQAILMLLRAPDVQVLGITVTSGDGWRDENTAHALRLLEIAGRTDVPVFRGAVQPLLNSERRTLAWEQAHGRLYYKGAWTQHWPDQGAVRRTPYHADPALVPASPAGQPHTAAQAEAAASFMVRMVQAHPGEVTIWAGGPLSNVALAARLDPQFASLAKELVFMGGSFNPVAADNPFADEYRHNPRLEFNMRWDAEAASLVLHEPWRHITQVPIDPTTRTFFKPAFFDEIARAGTPVAAYLKAYGQSFPMWDELAAAVWLDPTLVTRRSRMRVDIDTAPGAGYGSTLSWPLDGGPGLGEQPVDVVLDVDVPRFERLAIDLLK
jgi:inosine-uridine nucleoside N-ribohydrolase